MPPPLPSRRVSRLKKTSKRASKRSRRGGEFSRLNAFSRRFAVAVRRLNAPIAVFSVGAALFTLVLLYTLLVGGSATSDSMLEGGSVRTTPLLGVGQPGLDMGRFADNYFARVVGGAAGALAIERVVAKTSLRGTSGSAAGGARSGAAEPLLTNGLHQLVHDADYAVNSSTDVLALIDAFVKTQEDGMRRGVLRGATPAPSQLSAAAAAEEAEFEAVLDSLDIETLLNVTAGKLSKHEIITMFQKTPILKVGAAGGAALGSVGAKLRRGGQGKGASGKPHKKKLNMTKFKVVTKAFLASIGRNVTLFTTVQLRDAVIVGLSDVLSLAIPTLQGKGDEELEALALRQTMDPLARYLHSIGRPARTSELPMSIRERAIQALVDEGGELDEDVRDKDLERLRKLPLRALWKMARASTFTFVRRRRRLLWPRLQRRSLGIGS